MRKFILLFSIIVLCKNVQAQYLPFIENGKVWQKICSYGRGGTSGCIYHLGCPVVLDGKEYYPYYAITNGPTLFGYVREDPPGEKLYYLPPYNGQEVMIADLTAELGDTVLTGYYGGKLVVSSVKYEQIMGATRKVLTLTRGFVPNPQVFTEKLIEGVGSIFWGLEMPRNGSTWGQLQNITFENQYRCSLATSIVPVSLGELNISPNPSSDFIVINGAIQSPYLLYYQLFALNGTLLDKGIINNDAFKINISHLPAQMLILRLQNQEGALSTRIVKN